MNDTPSFESPPAATPATPTTGLPSPATGTSDAPLSKNKAKALARATAKAAARAQHRSSAGAAAGGPSNHSSQPRVKPRTVPYAPAPSLSPAHAEQASVHDVYESIAPHFSSTRTRPWPLISRFLESVPSGSIGLDSGAGNGKYIPTARARGLEMIPLDRSAGLLGFAKRVDAFLGPGEVEGKGSRKGKMGEAVRGDLSARCWRGVFDFAISIAAIHHLSTDERRRDSVGALLSALHHPVSDPGPSTSPGVVGESSKFMLYVWAYEQGEKSKRDMGVRAAPPAGGDLASANGADKTSAGRTDVKVQDVLVPWVLQSQPQSASANGDSDPNPGSGRGGSEPGVYHRYYHLFVEGELERLVRDAARKEGYAVISSAGTDGENGQRDAAMGSESASTAQAARKWLRVRDVGWEMDNWYIIGDVGAYAAAPRA